MPEEDIFCATKRKNLTYADIKTLMPRTFVNENVVSAFLRLLPSFDGIYTTDWSFYNELQDSGLL